MSLGFIKALSLALMLTTSPLSSADVTGRMGQTETARDASCFLTTRLVNSPAPRSQELYFSCLCISCITVKTGCASGGGWDASVYGVQ